jgi:hypothetical protein
MGEYTPHFGEDMSIVTGENVGLTGERIGKARVISSSVPNTIDATSIFHKSINGEIFVKSATAESVP